MRRLTSHTRENYVMKGFSMSPKKIFKNRCVEAVHDLVERVHDPLKSVFPDMPCMKRVYKDKKASFHWSAARKKARFSSR